jgi:integrase/recombinase XerD
MLRTLFPKYHRFYERSCCANELEAFAGWLQAVGYSRGSTCAHIRCLRRTLEQARCASAERRYADREVREMFAAPFASTSAVAGARATERLYRRFLAVAGRLSPARPRHRDPRASLLIHYRGYLTEARGFTASTVEQHLTTVADFLQRALGAGRPLRELTSRYTDEYVARRAGDVSRETLQHIVARLRAFFRYCDMQRLVRRRLDTIDTPRTYRGERPPRALPWPVIQQLLRSIDCAGKAGWRDYAILHLMAHYGLRPSEVVALRLDSIDWVMKTMHVEQRKTQSTLLLPLMPRTMTLLRRYLALGRPRTEDRHLFLRVRDPAGPLQHTAICDLFRKRAKQVGLPLDQYCSYGLRHGFAVRLLTRGVGIKAIGDLLGHRSFESTQVYLRLDTDLLRAIALPVPRSSQTRRRA